MERSVVFVVDTDRKRVEVVPQDKIEKLVFGGDRAKLFVYTGNNMIETRLRGFSVMTKVLQLFMRGDNILIVNGQIVPYRELWRVLQALSQGKGVVRDAGVV